MFENTSDFEISDSETGVDTLAIAISNANQNYASMYIDRLISNKVEVTQQHRLILESLKNENYLLYEEIILVNPELLPPSI